jgi:hypothetical protein
MEMTKGQLLQINFAPVWKGTIHMHKNLTPENVDFCPAYALQKLMFGTVDSDTEAQDMLVDATVSHRIPVAELPTSTLFRSNNRGPFPMSSNFNIATTAATAANLIAPAAAVNSTTSASVPVAAKPVAAKQVASVSAAAVSTASLSAASVSVAAVPVVSVPVASVPFAAGTSSVSDVSTRSISAVLDEAVKSADSSNAAPKAKAGTSKSDWDFETEIENMFAAEQSSGKPKRPKTKSSTTALQPAL